MEQIAKNIIDDYVDSANYKVNRLGKTLSITDLNFFEDIKAKIGDFLDELITKLHVDESSASQIAIAIENSRVYSKSSRPVAVDLQDLAINVIDSFSDDREIVTKADSLLSELGKYVIYSRHDGSRHYSYGVTIDLPSNPPKSVSLNPSIKALQTLWWNIMVNDTELPDVSGEKDGVSVGDINLFDPTIDQEILDSLLAAINSGTYSGTELAFLQSGYKILTDSGLLFNEKMVELDALENDNRGVFVPGFLRHSSLGDAFDEAMATCITVSDTNEAKEYPDYSKSVISLFDLLYNENTIDYSVIWNWSNVDWQLVTPLLNTLQENFEKIRQKVCP